MMVRMSAQKTAKEFTVVNVVRRGEQREDLVALGALPENVVVTSDADWQDQLRARIKALNITVALDAVAGNNTGTLMGLMPKNSHTIVYGNLAGQIGNM
jgi:NADPH:quinone reductase-like Zn-dependent oxidoreductase